MVNTRGDGCVSSPDGGNPFTMYTDIKSSPCTLYIAYNLICHFYLKKLWGKLATVSNFLCVLGENNLIDNSLFHKRGHISAVGNVDW